MHYAPQVSMPGTLTTIANGRSGIFQTVRLMRELVNQYRITPEIRQAAVSCIFLMPEKNTDAEITSIFNFVRDQVRYVRDILNVETIATPDKILQCRFGDCDDQSVLLASLFESVGYPTRFVIAGYSGDQFEHVYVQVCAGYHWIDCDATEQMPIGYAPPNPTIIFCENF